MQKTYNIAIIGSGALGLYYGGLLACFEQSGGSISSPGGDALQPMVHFLMRADYAHARRNGLTVESCDGDYRLEQISVYRQTADMPDIDLVLIGLKTTANAHYKELISPVYRPGKTSILCLQNGIGNEEELASHFAPADIIGGVSFLCSNRTAAACINHTDYGHIQMSLYYNDPDAARHEAARQNLVMVNQLMTAAKIRSEVVADYLEMRWRKQVWNVAFNGLCTLYDMGTEELLADRGRAEEVRQVMTETIDLARAHHQALLKAGFNRSEKFGLEYDFITLQFERTATMGNYLPSMLLDRREGRELETNSIVTACLRIRDEHGIDLDLPAITRLNNELASLQAK